jgi:thiamine-phosphate pyrophosphorylase
VPTFDLLAISDRSSLGEVSFEEWLRRLAAACVGAVQIREKDLNDRDLYELTLGARATLPPPAVLLVNGRMDVALAAGADGCHLPADGVPLAALRRRFGPQVLLGRSTHHVEDVERAAREGADYVTFGPVYSTPSKAQYGPPRGLEELARAAGAGIPVYALGGVTLSRFAEVAAAGAAGVAGIRLFQEPELFEAVEAARRHFSR